MSVVVCCQSRGLLGQSRGTHDFDYKIWCLETSRLILMLFFLGLIIQAGLIHHYADLWSPCRWKAGHVH